MFFIFIDKKDQNKLKGGITIIFVFMRVVLEPAISFYSPPIINCIRFLFSHFLNLTTKKTNIEMTWVDWDCRSCFITSERSFFEWLQTIFKSMVSRRNFGVQGFFDRFDWINFDRTNFETVKCFSMVMNLGFEIKNTVWSYLATVFHRLKVAWIRWSFQNPLF